MRKIAAILLYRDGKFLLQHRTDDAPTYPGEYGFFGGGMDEGENPTEAVKRECLEELEYELQNPKLVLNAIYAGRYGKRQAYVFLEKYDLSQTLVLHEGKGMKWVAHDEMNDLHIADIMPKF